MRQARSAASGALLKLRQRLMEIVAFRGQDQVVKRAIVCAQSHSSTAAPFLHIVGGFVDIQ